MSFSMHQRPVAEEYAPYYGQYIRLVPDGGILDLLENQIATLVDAFRVVPEDQEVVLHPPHTWTIRQVAGHMIDVEKVFGYRAHRFACNDLRPIPGMEQNDWVKNLNYKVTSLKELAVELQCARRANLLFLKRIPKESWDRTGAADGNTLSVRAVAYILVGHVTHHLSIIERRLA